MRPEQVCPRTGTAFHNETDIINPAVVISVYFQVWRNLRSDIVNCIYKHCMLTDTAIRGICVANRIGCGIWHVIVARKTVLIGSHDMVEGQRIKRCIDRQSAVGIFHKVIVHGIRAGHNTVEHIIVGSKRRCEFSLVRKSDKDNQIVDCAAGGGAVCSGRVLPPALPFLAIQLFINIKTRCQISQMRVNSAHDKLRRFKVFSGFAGIGVITGPVVLNYRVIISVMQPVVKFIT